MLGEAPASPPFPVEVLPDELRQLVEEAACAFPCPIDYVAVPLLVIAGGAIGASRSLAIKAGHEQRACLYAAVVGPPGTLKTPAQDLVVAPAHEAEERLHSAWEEAVERYNAELERYEADLKGWRKAKPDGRGDAPKKPNKPALERLTVSDATAEALVPILKENPRGVVLVRDELAGWVLAMNQYREGGKGADQQFFLSAWSGSTVTVDRKKTHDLGPLRVRHPFLSVVGGLTPDRLPTLRGDTFRQKAGQDGFIDRVLLAYPAPMPASGESWEQVSEAALGDLRETLARLRGLGMVVVVEGGLVVGHRPYLVRLTACGRAAWKRFTDAHAAELNAPDFPDHLRGPWSKLRGYCGRLALIVHYLRWACGEVASDTSDVDGESVGRAAKLVAYFKGQARRVYSLMDVDVRVKAAKKVWDWVAREERKQFKRWEAYEDLKSDGFFPTPASLDDPLEVLEGHNLVRAQGPPPRAGAGRKPAPLYLVNPLALRPENPVNPGNGGEGDG
jgi:hypothetical protein